MNFIEKKREENIAEYVLFMYQMEDLLRACNLDVDLAVSVIADEVKDEAVRTNYRLWYTELIRQMRQNGLEKKGHLPELTDIMLELSYLHNTLLSITNNKQYQEVFSTTQPVIEEFRDRSDLSDKNHIEVVFHALYMKLLMKLKNQPISPESESAFMSMQSLLALLSKAYHNMKRGELDFLKN